MSEVEVAASESSMLEIASLGSSTRLIAVQFLMNESYLIPNCLFGRKHSSTVRVDGDTKSVLPTGREVLTSKKNVYLLHLLDGICPGSGKGPYELVDAWAETRLNDRSNYKRAVRFAVRYVFCHKDHVRTADLFPGFVSKRDEIFDSLLDFASKNLWQTQGHLNPFFEEGKPTGHDVLMLGCTGRNHILDSRGAICRVWSGGRDDLGQGIGDLVPITDVRPKLRVIDGKVFLDHDLSWI